MSEAVAGARQTSDALLGTVIDGRYQLESLLGEGGMGLVYRATHTRLGKAFAIKVLRQGNSRDPSAMARFQLEAQSASAIGNAHIVDVSDFGTLPDGSTYFVMEYLKGVDLISATDAAGPMPAERACHIAIQLCRALGAAHEIGIVHRDLKPENVFLLDRDGDPDFVKVLDFGIAKVAHATTPLTQDTDILGTPHYMSPEQCEGLGIDHRTDIYALGVLIYEMLAARVPHDADTAMAILHKHVYSRPTPIDLYVPQVPPSLKRIIERCLEKKPERRYQSMAELRVELERAQIEARTAPLARSGWRARIRRHSRRPLGWAAAALIALLGAIATNALSSDRAEPLASDASEMSVPRFVDRGPPAALARPAADAAVQSQIGAPNPPASLVRPAEPTVAAHSRPKSTNRKLRSPVRRPALKKARKATTQPKRQKSTGGSDEVLDPWM